ncbi:CATRA conflict system CASPASE/TPR repeat-associated protein [Cryptosporangium sp. NPDC051539]|uniref:CATRA conflict system CASPASE/TPR repeat-associated protein n=1 Tax=Cryptosporangium sp. NPDC051539 TaxID=3363962 RepID=UPI0037936A30
MPGPFLPEQELVAHLFAPIGGPLAGQAFDQISEIWQRCRSELGMTLSIPGTELSTELPPPDALGAEGDALAGLQDRVADYQAIVRHEHEVLNLSLVFATPVADHHRKPRIGAAAPLGWREYARWWQQLTVDGIDALLGSAVIYQAKRPAESTDSASWGADAGAVLPPAPGDDPGWRQRPSRAGEAGEFALWEVAPESRDGGNRRLVVLADPGRDSELSDFTWSSGGVELPPLARYLMHAAKLRFHARVRGDGSALQELSRRLETHANRIGDALGTSRPSDDTADLVRDEAILLGTRADLRRIRRSVEIAEDNMTSAIGELLPSDAKLLRWLKPQLADDIEFLDITREQTESVRRIAKDAGLFERRPETAPDGSVLAPPAPALRQLSDQVEQRLGFGIDVVGYSTRSTPQQVEVQHRIATLVEQVVTDIGVPVAATDRQDAGDGMMVVLPAGIEVPTALPRLLLGWRARLAADNDAHDDRLRMRLAVSMGGFSKAAIGYAGGTIIEIGRLLDSNELRNALKADPGLELAALLSDPLYQQVVGEGFDGVGPEEFESCEVENKQYRRAAWLWRGGVRRVALPADLVDEMLRIVVPLPGRRLPADRWTRIEPALASALSAVAGGDEPAFTAAIVALYGLTRFREGRIGAAPGEPATPAVRDRVAELAGRLKGPGGDGDGGR